MRSTWAVMTSIGILAIGFTAGLLYRGTPAGCISGKQYIVEFRTVDKPYSEPIPGLMRATLNHAEVMLAVDGKTLGKIGLYQPPIRRFLCEGNHRAEISFGAGDSAELHRVDFTVTRASLFHATEWQPDKAEPKTCVSEACVSNVGLDLSPLEPDENLAREYRIVQRASRR